MLSTPDQTETLETNSAAHMDERFATLMGCPAFSWQRRLLRRFLSAEIPSAIDLPTGLGKTSVMAIWYLALKAGASVPRRLVYVVDRRAVVDQATEEAEKIKERSGDATLRISTLRGQHADNRAWLEDPSAPAIIVGTVDMIGSRLLFSGYGVSRKMRPYHAGLLGADTLLVLDESHLVPPFERLLAAIEGNAAQLGAREAAERKIVPPFRLLSLSATGYTRNGEVFRLDDEDRNDDPVVKRLGAVKTLTTIDIADGKLEDALAKEAWALSKAGTKPIRCLVYCDSRNVAERTKAAIEKLAKSAGIPSGNVQLFVSARRVKERNDAAAHLKALGFLAGSDVVLDKPAFLVATSAGEVGIDLDAQHMVCDLAPWERMVQRLGRVNRRGNGEARVVVVHGKAPKPKTADAPKPDEARAMIAWYSRAVLTALPATNSGIDVSPGALLALKLRAERDGTLRELLEAATTPPPIYPALARPLVDAWSMTSLENHTGRPEVAPWLRGWIDNEEPRTVLVWREHLPVRTQGGDATDKEIAEFFEAAPPHLSEKLETESWRVAEWMIKRAQAVRTAENDITAFMLASDGSLRRTCWIGEFAGDKGDKKKIVDRLASELAGTTLIVDARMGGLTDGLLDGDAPDAPAVADAGAPWIEGDGSPVIGFRIRVASTANDLTGDEWRESFRFDLERSDEGEPLRWLMVEGLNEESRAQSRNPQRLEVHQDWAANQAKSIAERVGLEGLHADALIIAARLHDEGKRASCWQRAFNAPGDGPYAKTKGPVNLKHLDGYRHEFGSLPFAERDPQFQRLPPEFQDLVLHLIASHHGGARPLISKTGCEDAPPSALETRAELSSSLVYEIALSCLIRRRAAAVAALLPSRVRRP